MVLLLLGFIRGMAVKRFNLCLCIVILMGFLSLSNAYKFYVGGKDGWVLNPIESYSHWAERKRFQVNDTLYFGYKKGTNSVLVVTKEDYFSCSAENPIKSLTEGDSPFVFDRSGAFFFISGNKDNCFKGQKLVVVVMAVRNQTHRHHRVQPPSPSPAAAAPTSASPSPVQPPARSPGENPSELNAPATAPPGQKSGSVYLAGSRFGSVLGILVISLVFGFVAL